MKTITVSIMEGKKNFTQLIHNAIKNKEDIVVTKRGKPVAVIVPYVGYKHFIKVDAYKKILESRNAFLKAGVSSESVYRQSKDQLEKRP